MTNESQITDETDAEHADDAPASGRPSTLDALLASPLAIVMAVVVVGAVLGAAVFFAAAPEDTDGPAFEARPVTDQIEFQAEAAEWRTIIDSGAEAAGFNDASLSWAELEGMLERLPAGSPEYFGVPDPTTSGQIVRQWLITLALEDEFEARGIVPDAFDAELARTDTLSRDPSFDENSPFGELALRTQTLSTTLDRTVDELAALEDIERPEYLCASHILVETNEEAQEIVELLDDGADFATLAIERSGDGAAPLGGDLGCGATIGYVPEFSDGARATGEGNISEPVQSQFGWHVISVRTIGELTPENHPEMTEQEIDQALGSFDLQARENIANDIGLEIVNAAWERVAAGASIDDRIGQWDPAQRFVVPPEAA